MTKKILCLLLTLVITACSFAGAFAAEESVIITYLRCWLFTGDESVLSAYAHCRPRWPLSR